MSSCGPSITEVTPWALRKRDSVNISVQPLTDESAELVASWLSTPSYSQWLDFGNGRRQLSAKSLLFLARCGSHHIRTFHEESGRTVGVAGLHHVDSFERRAMLWVIRPRLRPPVRKTSIEDAIELLRTGFVDYGLKSIFAKVAEGNRLSRLLVEAMGLKEVGRERAAHRIDDSFHDRVVYDILAEEFFERHPWALTSGETHT